MDTDTRVEWIAKLKGGPLTMLMLLLVYQRPVHARELIRRTKWDRATARKHLASLEYDGIANQVDDWWQLPAHGRQLALELIATPRGVAGEIAPATNGQLAAPDDPVMSQSRGENFSPSISSLLRESDLITDSLKTKKTARENFAGEKFSPPDLAAVEHVGALVQALARKGLPAPAAEDPLPAELRLCVEALVRIGAPRRKAELAVAASPWDAATIAAEVQAWQAHRASPAGRGITIGGFPYLVLARISAGEPCPTQLTAAAERAADPLSGYDGYTAFVADINESE